MYVCVCRLGEVRNDRLITFLLIIDTQCSPLFNSYSIFGLKSNFNHLERKHCHVHSFKGLFTAVTANNATAVCVLYFALTHTTGLVVSVPVRAHVCVCV